MTPHEIRTRRERLGITQSQAAHLVGVDARTWRKWECRERAMPTPVIRLLRLMGDAPPSIPWLAHYANVARATQSVPTSTKETTQCFPRSHSSP
jgi:DNA-binding XRE family transcriptional regulator